MTKTNLLKSKMALYDLTISKGAALLDLSETQFRKKVNGEAQFYQPEIATLKKALHLTDAEVIEIFLS